MKNINLLTVLLVLLAACKESKTSEKSTGAAKEEMAYNPIDDTVLEKAVIYEANIRQYSPEGTLNAFAKNLPKLKEMGVDIIWLMPIYPIGEAKRKGSLGSYYAIKNYHQINPEFGTMADLKALVQKAHAMDMYVILDWVANHTAWDHHWISEKPDYYVKDSVGGLISPYDWTDVVKLDYGNPEVRMEMRSEMSYWINEADIDGFRCDVAGEVPTDFWKTTIDSLKNIKPIFMLAEAEKPELLENGFDMQYAWEGHHLMNGLAQGKNQVQDWDDYVKKIDSLLPQQGFVMNFTSNHDENSWNGTVMERLGEAAELFAALTFVAPGMPLVYSGQENDMDKRLAFFEKDTMPNETGHFYGFYQKMGALKKATSALDGAKKAASYRKWLNDKPSDILAFERSKQGESVLFIANISDKSVRFTMEEQGEYHDYLRGEAFHIEPNVTLELGPWEYRVLLPVKME